MKPELLWIAVAVLQAIVAALNLRQARTNRRQAAENLRIQREVSATYGTKENAK